MLPSNLTLEVRGCGAKETDRRNDAGSAVPLDRKVRCAAEDKHKSKSHFFTYISLVVRCAEKLSKTERSKDSSTTCVA